MVMQSIANLGAGGSIPGMPAVGAGAAVCRLGFEPLTYTSAVSCFTT